MTDRPSDPKCIECRLVVIEPDSMRILTTKSAEGALLPHESIPEHTRVAESLTESIERKYGFRTIQLALLPGAEDGGYCAIHEIMGSQQSALRSFVFANLDEIPASEITDTQRLLVLKIMKGEANELGRFARLGWNYELLA
jgi:hypothetical protein